MNFLKIYDKRIIDILSIVLLLVMAGNAYAQGGPIVPCGIGGGTCTICHIPVLIKNLIDFAIKYIAIPLAGLMFGICGFFYITSGGNPGRVNQAKSIFMSTVIGVAWVFGSWMVISQILFILTGSGSDRFYGLDYPWYQIPPPTSCNL